MIIFWKKFPFFEKSSVSVILDKNRRVLAIKRANDFPQALCSDLLAINKHFSEILLVITYTVTYDAIYSSIMLVSFKITITAAGPLEIEMVVVREKSTQSTFILLIPLITTHNHAHTYKNKPK